MNLLAMRRIAHLSDLHFGRHSLTVMEDLLASLHAHEPDLVVLSGDLTQRARPGEFLQARLFINRIVPPRLIVPGNHDVPLYHLFERLLNPFARYERYIAPLDHPEGFFRDDELAVLGLNSARPFNGIRGRVRTREVGLIAKWFASTPDRLFRIIVTHHPLGQPGDRLDMPIARHSRFALDAVGEAGVHLLLSGHHHRSLSGSMETLAGGRSVLIIYAGTAISTRTRGGEGNSYNLIDIEPDAVCVREMTWQDGRAFIQNRVRDYSLRDGRWTAPSQT